MYVLPKGLESVWIMARGKGWVFKTGNWGEGLVGVFSLFFPFNRSLFSRVAYGTWDGYGDGKHLLYFSTSAYADCSFM